MSRRRVAADGADPYAEARVPSKAWWAQDWYFAVALALFVGVGVWFSRAIADFLAPSAKTIAAPALVGETLGDALVTLDRMKLRGTVVRKAASDRYPRDVIMRQDPLAGTQVRAGRQISLVVSTGVQIFPMPDLRYESLREVGLDLSHAKLVLGRVRQVPSEEVQAGRVVSQRPLPLTSVRVGTTVDVDLSRGGPSAVDVPNFTGSSIGDARARATDAHVRIGQIVWTPFGRAGKPRGTVVAQRPGPGAQIEPSQSVSLQVSAGPREAGYLVRQVHATVEVPQDAGAGGTPTLRVQVRDETGTWNVYRAFVEPRQKLDFNLSVIGTADLDVFVNDALISSTILGVEPPVQETQHMGPPPPRPSAVPSGRSARPDLRPGLAPPAAKATP